MKVAYLGMGNMGWRMAANLYKAGFETSVWARPEGNSWKNVEMLMERGLKGCRTIAEAIEGAEIIATCVTNDAAVNEVCGEILKTVKPGTVIMDHSTIGPHTAESLRDEFAEKGCDFLDVPISGGETGAEAGTLTLMAGGDKKAFDKCKGYFDAVSSYAVYMGATGTGCMTKLLANQMSGINHVVVCEAVNEAKRIGIDIESFYTVVTHAWGRSHAFERIVLERLKDNTFYPSYAPCEMINKDLHHAVELADELGIDAKFAKMASEYYQRSCDIGHNKWDQASVILLMEQDNPEKKD